MEQDSGKKKKDLKTFILVCIMTQYVEIAQAPI